jgi:hypothetical protein
MAVRGLWSAIQQRSSTDGGWRSTHGQWSIDKSGSTASWRLTGGRGGNGFVEGAVLESRPQYRKENREKKIGDLRTAVSTAESAAGSVAGNAIDNVKVTARTPAAPGPS